jgi:hypothetical protein
MRLLDTGSVKFKILFAIFVPGPATPGVEEGDERSKKRLITNG